MTKVVCAEKLDLHPNLSRIIEWVAGQIGHRKYFGLTEGNGKGGKTVFALRTVYTVCLNPVVARAIVFMINTHWEYDPGQPGVNVAVYKEYRDQSIILISVHNHTNFHSEGNHGRTTRGQNQP